MDWSQQGKTFTCGLRCTVSLGLVVPSVGTHGGSGFRGAWCLFSSCCWGPQHEQLCDPQEHCGRLKWLHELLGSSVMPPGPAASDQARQWWWLEPVVCIRLPAAGACGKAWFSCRHTSSGGGQSGQQGLEETLAAGTLSCDYIVSPLQGRTALEVRPGMCRCTARGNSYR